MDSDGTFAGSIDENARRRFEAAWRSGRPEAIEQYIPAAQDARFLATLEELVHIDLEMHWKKRREGSDPTLNAGPPPSTEAYLQRFPPLQEPTIILRLLQQEYRVRRLYGDAPLVDEYRTRFPNLISTGHELAATSPNSAFSDSQLPQIPGYEVLRPIGRGGMGIVYMARQEGLGRTVAIKTLSASAQGDSEDQARFRSEAEAIARFQDPNIVHIYEVGEASGRLYFSMEFLEGGGLDRKLARTPQPARASAQMIEVLARSMARVHERGLVHRDLKPANVLLAPDGTPKVSDFGLAKRLEGPPGQTQSGAILGTPSYMAPEQAAGKLKLIGPATDIYALGAILYEMLTGRPPFLGEGPVETAMLVISSEVVPPRRLQPTIPRDLETIALKCLEKDIGRRYVSAAALADDLGRFLRDEPIQARPVGRLERTWRWGRRNRLVAASLSALAVIIPVALVALTWLWLRADFHRNQAQVNLERARVNSRKAHDAVDQLLTHLGYDKLVEVPSMEPAVREVIETALEFNKGFLAEEGDDPAVRFEVARAYRRAGWIERGLGRYDEAESHFRDGLGILDKLIIDYPRESAYRVEQGLLLSYWAGLCEKLGRFDEAERFNQSALIVRQQLVNEAPADLDHRLDLAETYEAIGDLAWRERLQLDKAEKNLNRAIELRREAMSSEPEKPMPQWRLAENLAALSSFLELAGRRDDALAARKEGLEFAEQLVHHHPDDPRYRHELIAQLYNMAVFHSLTQSQEAESFYHRALKQAETLTNQFPSRPAYRERLAEIEKGRGDLYLRTGRFLEAQRAYDRSVKAREKLIAAFPRVPDYRSQLAATFAAVRVLRVNNQNVVGSEVADAYQAAIDQDRALLKELPQIARYQSNLAIDLENYGAALGQIRRFDDAEKALREALDLNEKLVKRLPDVPDYRLRLGTCCSTLGVLYWRTRRLKEAEEIYNRGSAVLRKLADEAPIPQYRLELAAVQANLAVIYRNTKRLAESEKLHRANVEMGEKFVADFPKMQQGARFLCDVYMAFGLLLVSTGRHEEAEKGYRRALEISQALLDESPDVPDYHNARAGLLDNFTESLLDRKGDLQEALKRIESAIDHEQRALKANPEHPQYRLFMSSHWGVLAEVKLRLGDHAAAAKAAQEMPKLFSKDASKYREAAELAARCIPLAERDAAVADGVRQQRVEAYAKLAIELLKRAVELGFNDVTELRRNENLAPLRGREEFQKLAEGVK